MRSRRYLFANLVTLFFIALWGCNSVNEPVNTSDNKTGSYLPLKVGNKWYYNTYSINKGNFDSTTYDMTWEVIDKKYLNGNEFFLLKKLIGIMTEQKAAAILFITVLKKTACFTHPKNC